MQVSTSYNHETVVLDGESFEGCEFRDCRLVYTGEAVPIFDQCRFDNCEWKFEGAAARTLAHLKLVWSVGGKAQVQAHIKEITGK
ncbi:hypothetical protein [Caulobacter sp. S45]|jgi:hypothetical protein|uniref:hypothetical protein n=1 Tax=Caulobacter sp. S45 TaxID=1641861 RepID=UPI00131E72B2|nr:hypothetical protein [Caulobacter sp. S45]